MAKSRVGRGKCAGCEKVRNDIYKGYCTDCRIAYGDMIVEKYTPSVREEVEKAILRDDWRDNEYKTDTKADNQD